MSDLGIITRESGRKKNYFTVFENTADFWYPGQKIPLRFWAEEAAAEGKSVAGHTEDGSQN